MSEHENISEYNPYVTKSMNQLVVAPEDLDKATRLQSMSFYAKFFAGVDLFMAILYVTLGAYPAMLLGFFSFVGYYGASRFKRNYILVYNVYQTIVIIAKMILFGLLPLSLDGVEIAFQMAVLTVNVLVYIFFMRFYFMIPPPPFEVQVLDI
jgi:hypothetical protein